MASCFSPEVLNNCKEEKELLNVILMQGLLGRHILFYNQFLLYPALYMHLHSVPIINFILVMQRTINNLRLKRNLRAGIFHFCSRDRWYAASMSTQVIFVHATLIQQIAFQTKCMQKVPGDSTREESFVSMANVPNPYPESEIQTEFSFLHLVFTNRN